MGQTAELKEREDKLQGMGASLLRKEDARFSRGQGTYIDDIKMPGMLFGALVRSPYAHARIKGIDKAKALACPGVVAVLVAADLKPVKLDWMPTVGGDVQAVLADKKVHFQYQEVAMVLATDRAAAFDGSGEPQHLVLREARFDVNRHHARLAFGKRSGLVHDENVDAGQLLQRFRVLDEDARVRAAARADHDGHRRGKPEGAWARDDQDGNSREQAVRETRCRPPDAPRDERDCRADDDGGHEVRGHDICELLNRRATPLRFGNHCDYARQQHLGTDLLCSHDQCAGAIDRGAHYAIARMFFDRDRLASDHRLVDGAGSLDNRGIHVGGHPNASFAHVALGRLGQVHDQHDAGLGGDTGHRDESDPQRGGEVGVQEWAQREACRLTHCRARSSRSCALLRRLPSMRLARRARAPNRSRDASLPRRRNLRAIACRSRPSTRRDDDRLRAD